MRPTKEQQKTGFEDGWGAFETTHGYGIFEAEHGLLVINRIDIMDTFSGDDEAVIQAKKDGFKFIVNNIIDCEENKLIIKEQKLKISDLKEEWL